MVDRKASGGIPPGVAFEQVTPILRVSDFEASVAYYVEALAFELAWRVGQFGCVERGDVALMLSQGSQGCASTWIYVGESTMRGSVIAVGRSPEHRLSKGLGVQGGPHCQDRRRRAHRDFRPDHPRGTQNFPTHGAGVSSRSRTHHRPRGPECVQDYFTRSAPGSEPSFC